ncbi:MAG: DUF1592 domain-containing protein [Planctomycetaceae bacterium]
MRRKIRTLSNQFECLSPTIAPLLVLALIASLLPGGVSIAIAQEQFGSNAPKKPDRWESQPQLTDVPVAVRPFLEQHCFDCHNNDTSEGDLSLQAVDLSGTTAISRAFLVTLYDRVAAHEMPPESEEQPADATRAEFLAQIAKPVIAAEQRDDRTIGRTTWRRMNRLEYEATLRDLLQAPWLEIKEMLPEDGESHRFNKIGDSLDVSHVQVAQYLQAADYALRAVLATQTKPIPDETKRYRARDDEGFFRRFSYHKRHGFDTDRATFPVLGNSGQPDVRAQKAPSTVVTHSTGHTGQPDVRAQKAPITHPTDEAVRELEAVGTSISNYLPTTTKFFRAKTPADGRYTIRLNAYSIWLGPGAKDWWRPNLDVVSKGRRDEPITVYAERASGQTRRLGAFDVGAEPTTRTLEVYLLKGETITVDAARLHRSRYPRGWQNPLATPEGQPGVAFRWLEVSGPHTDGHPGYGHRILFGDLPYSPAKKNEPFAVASSDPIGDAERLLRQFMAKAYRQPVADTDVDRFLGVISAALDGGNSFADAMIAGYSAVLCSPTFVCLEEKPGLLDHHAVANRLSYFLWNSAPDDQLRALADAGKLHDLTVLRQETKRLLADARSDRFIEAFLGYWLDLRKISDTTPDSVLYADYYLDDLLVESSLLETQAFFKELIQTNAPARILIDSDFVMINERLADHYNIPDVSGVAIRKVAVPKGNPRGGIMTQASVLKVTANGTTTSGRASGLGDGTHRRQNTPAATTWHSSGRARYCGATTIREQLAKHRSDPNCASCHTKIDPAGFALENFDVMGGWRDQYRAIGEGGEKVAGRGKNGQPFAFHLAAPVDPSGELPDGRTFADVRGLKQALLQDERQIARNIAKQLTIYATGAGIRFADRPAIEQLLDQCSDSQYGIRDIIVAIVQSDLFRHK